jgi:hypothetical protein
VIQSCLAHCIYETGVLEECPKGFEPIVPSSRKESCLSLKNDVVGDADRACHGRERMASVLDRPEGALPPRPRIVGQWSDAHGRGEQRVTGSLRGPRHKFGRKWRRLPCSRAHDSQAKVNLARKSLERPPYELEVLEVIGKAHPHDHGWVGPARGRRIDRLDRGRDLDDSLRVPPREAREDAIPHYTDVNRSEGSFKRPLSSRCASRASEDETRGLLGQFGQMGSPEIGWDRVDSVVDVQDEPPVALAQSVQILSRREHTLEHKYGRRSTCLHERLNPIRLWKRASRERLDRPIARASQSAEAIPGAGGIPAARRCEHDALDHRHLSLPEKAPLNAVAVFLDVGGCGKAVSRPFHVIGRRVCDREARLPSRSPRRGSS